MFFEGDVEEAGLVRVASSENREVDRGIPKSVRAVVVGAARRNKIQAKASRIKEKTNRIGIPRASGAVRLASRPKDYTLPGKAACRIWVKSDCATASAL